MSFAMILKMFADCSLSFAILGMVETEFSEVRFHGDKERAAGVYKGVEALQGEDIAEAIAWMLSLPAHMNVNDIVLMPTCQAGAYYTYRK